MCLVTCPRLECEKRVMSKPISFVLLSMLCAGLGARAIEAVSLPTELPPLDKRGDWRETLEDLAGMGVPQSWTFLGPISNETARSFEKQLDAEKSDDWSKPQTDNMGRLMHLTEWTRPKDEEGCYVDLADIFSTPPISPVVCALAAIDSPIEGPALLWFENAGRAIVYFNDRQVLAATGKKPKYDGSFNALYPIAVDLKRGRNFLKIKILKERSSSQKGWGFYARVERNDLEWRKLLLGKLKELYPDEDQGPPGAQERLMLARLYEKSAQPEAAVALNKDVLEHFASQDDACEDARDALIRLGGNALKSNPSDAGKNWIDADRQFKAALASGQTQAADQAMREFIARFPFSDEAGLALCNRGGLRLDYAYIDSARPFYERALREYSGNETARTLGVKALEFARFYKPDHAQLDTNRTAETTLASIQRLLRNGNRNDNAAGLKSFGELLAAQPGALVRAGGAQAYPRCAGLSLLAREFVGTLSPEEQAQFREPFARAAEMQFREAAAFAEPLDLEALALRFPGAPASAKALNHAGNIYLDRGLYARAAEVFRAVLRDYKGSGLADEPLAAAKEIRALEGLGQYQAARGAAQKMRRDFPDAKFVLGGRETSAAEFAASAEKRFAAQPAAAAEAGRSDTETFAANTRRLGAGGVPVTPGATEWTLPLRLSEFTVRARSMWSEDRSNFHIEPFPVAAAGRVFLATRDSVRAVDLDSGREAWKKTWNDAGYVISDRFSGFPQTLPVYKDGRLFVRVVSGDKDSVIRCYDAAGGNVVWDTEKIQGLRSLVWSSEPLAAYNLVFTTYIEPLDHDTVRCGAAALDARTGALVWKRPFGIGSSGVRIAEKVREWRVDQILYRVTMQLGPPSAYEGTIFTATGMGSLAALNAYTGEVAWITEYPRLRAANTYTGNSGIEGFLPRLLKVLARGPSSPVVGEDTVALAPRDAAGVAAFDRRTGELRWTRELLDARFIAGICDGKLIAADDTVTALDLDSGKVAWEYASGKHLAGQPGFAGGVLYLPCDDALHVVDARTGTFKSRHNWDPKTSGPIANIIFAGQHLVGVNNSVLGAIGVK